MSETIAVFDGEAEIHTARIEVLAVGTGAIVTATLVDEDGTAIVAASEALPAWNYDLEAASEAGGRIVRSLKAVLADTTGEQAPKSAALVTALHTADITLEVAGERSRQQAKGWTTEHDDEAGVAHIVQEAHYRLGHMGEVSSPQAVRHELLKVAALAVAGIETIDRETRKNEETVRTTVQDIADTLSEATGIPPERIHTGRHPLDMD